MKINISFAVKMSFIISIVVFIVVISVFYFSLNLSYKGYADAVVGLLEVLNKGSIKRYFLGSINTLSNIIIAYKDEKNLSEYQIYSERIKKSINIPDEVFKTFEDNKTRYIVSSFLYDGTTIISEDETITKDTNFLNFIKEQIQSGNINTNFYISTLNGGVMFFTYLKDKIVGIKFNYNVYSTTVLRSTFSDIPIIFLVEEKDNTLNLLDLCENNLPKETIIKNYKEMIGQMPPNALNEKIFYASSKVDEGYIYVLNAIKYSFGIIKYVIVQPTITKFPIGIIEFAHLTGLPIAVFIFLIIMLTFGKAFKNLKLISKEISEISEKGGDLSFRIESKITIKEITEITNNLNKILDGLENLIKNTKEIFSIINDNLSLLNELDTSIKKQETIINRQNQIKEKINEVDKMSNESNSILEIINNSIELITTEIDKQFQLIEENNQMIEEIVITIENIIKRIEKLNDLTKELRNQSVKSSIDIEKSIGESKDVSTYLENVIQVITIIKEITDRIEVLSMNASIEATHAGEYGRGFLVVAQEMGNLAEDSRRKATEIEQAIKDIITKIKTNISEFEENGKKFIEISEGLKNISNFVNEINSSTQEMSVINKMLLDKINQLFKLSFNTKNKINEDKKNIENAIKNIYAINTSIQILNEEFNNFYSISKEITEKSLELSNKLPILTNNIQKLGKELDKFKIREKPKLKGITLLQ